MSFLQKLIGKKENHILSTVDFWQWFTKHEQAFFKTVKTQHKIEEKFLNQLSDKLD
ncbi:MAG: hypothetical protein WEA59_02020 [Ferruginibacter sp.]